MTKRKRPIPRRTPRPNHARSAGAIKTVTTTLPSRRLLLARMARWNACIGHLDNLELMPDQETTRAMMIAVFRALLKEEETYEADNTHVGRCPARKFLAQDESVQCERNVGTHSDHWHGAHVWQDGDGQPDVRAWDDDCTTVREHMESETRLAQLRANARPDSTQAIVVEVLDELIELLS